MDLSEEKTIFCDTCWDKFIYYFKLAHVRHNGYGMSLGCNSCIICESDIGKYKDYYCTNDDDDEILETGFRGDGVCEVCWNEFIDKLYSNYLC